MSGTTVIKLGFNQEWKVLSVALKSDPTFEVEEIATASEAATFLSTVSSALVLISLAKKEDLIQVASLVKIYKKVAPDTAVKISVINFSGDRNYEKAIAKLGIQDIIDPIISTKALRFKVDFWIKGLNVQVKKNEADLAVKTASKTSVEAAKSNQKSPDASGINWIEPMDCVDDFWLIKNEGDCKRVLGKWLIRITGPGPYVAQWTEVNGRNNLWKFEFRKEERENFFDSDGHWFFRGEQKPDFQWRENVWMITGNQFDLFYQDSKKLSSRISFANKILTITKNSEYARTKETMVFASFDKEIVLKRNGNIQTNEAVDTEGGTDKLKNLEGKGKTDKTTSGPLSGKTKGVDDLSSGLLAMDLEPGGNKLNDGTMAGPASGKIAQGSQLSVENKDNEHNKYWKGHNEAKQYNATYVSSPTSDKVREGAMLDLENKSNEHKTHWKGHNEAEKFESEKERKSYGADEGSKERDYGGKSNTDKLNKFYGNGEKDRPSASEKNPASEGLLPIKAEQAEKKKSHLETEVSDLEHERDLKRQKKEAIEAKDRVAKDRIEKEKREKALKDVEAFEADKRDLKKTKDVPSAREKLEREGNEQAEKKKAHLETEVSDLEHERDLKRQKKEAIEAKDRVAKDRIEKEKREKVLKDEEAFEADKRNRKKTKDVPSAREEWGREENEQVEKNKEKGAFAEEGTGNLEGKSLTDKLKAHYRNREHNIEEEKEEGSESDELDDRPFNARKNLHRKESEARVRGDTSKRKTGDRDNEIYPDEAALENENGRENDGIEEKGSSKKLMPRVERERHENIASLEEARKIKDLQRVLEDEEKDPELEEATQSGEIKSYMLINNQKVSCKFDDFFDQTVILSTNDKGINSTSEVELDLSFSYLKKVAKLNFKGKVTETVDDEEGNKFVTLQVPEESVRAFEAFMKLYQVRQKNINFFMQKVKGL